MMTQYPYYHIHNPLIYKTVTDSAIVQRNRDKYFSKDDYDRIMEKYPLFKEWIDESTNPQTKDRPKQKKIK